MSEPAGKPSVGGAGVREDRGPRLGASPEAEGTRFRVWAPAAERVSLVLEDGPEVAMEREEEGLFETFRAGVGAGVRYRYRLDGGEPLPDPASRFQPEGVHGPSQVVDPDAFAWRHPDWGGVPQRELVVYELHVGTFTPEGTFEAARERLPHLAELGVTGLELMPLHDFPGRWNWGYDPAALFAPSRAYGTPDELRRLVDEAHGLGLAVLADVVWNHLGPDGAYLPAFAPGWFTERHHTPWGQAVNLDGEGSRWVRRLLLENARMWLQEYRMDGLRIDATHALVDDGEPHFLAELSAEVADLPGPRRLLMAEDHRNLRRLLERRDEGGYGLDAVWADDFHHQMRRALAGDHEGYYRDFSGRAEDIAATLERGWFYVGQRSENRGEARGTDPAGLPPEGFVLCLQNHDQIGNRALGERLHHEGGPHHASLAAFHAASAVLLFAPELPLLFMGQEWAASSPFQYFTDHNEELGRLVSEGRRNEFRDFAGFGGEVPDPQDPRTYERSKLVWEEREREPHARTLELYRQLLRLRRELRGELAASSPVEGGLVLRRGRHELLAALAGGVRLPLPSDRRERWRSEPEAGAVVVEADAVRFEAPGAVLLEGPGEGEPQKPQG